MFGPHLVLEGYDCSAKDKLADRNCIKNILQEFPQCLDMNIILPPQILDYDGGDIPEDKGISGFVIIAESHIAIHTFPEKGFFTLDIFSCKPFDTDLAIKFIVDKFKPNSFEHQIFNRGREFPRSHGRASQIMDSERYQIQKEFVQA